MMWSPWSASTLESSEGMALQSCPELGQGCWIFTSHMHQSLDVTTREGVRPLGRLSVQLS